MHTAVPVETVLLPSTQGKVERGEGQDRLQGATLWERTVLGCFSPFKGIVDALNAGAQRFGDEGVRPVVSVQHRFEAVREFREQVPWVVAKVLLDDIHHDCIHHVRQQAPCFHVQTSSPRGDPLEQASLA